MKTEIKRVDDVVEYCPKCLTCIQEDPESCPECGQGRYRNGWKPLELCPHAYLGYLIDERYLLDRFLGGGASGKVYRAVDRKLNRPFALKIVGFGRYQRAEEREEHMRRFRNEVQALSQLRNPHVINIYESFQLERDTSALLTEYIDGKTLAQMIDQEGALGTDRSVRLIQQVANGLHEAHEQGVVHRDVKPANIMIEQLPASGFFARILDFGLVHVIEDVSQTQGFRGTPLYAAPEQCCSDLKVDARSDIYTLGCVLFACLAGRPPFVGDDPIAIVEAHRSETAPRLSELPAGSGISRLLDALLADMLAKRPDDRPASLRQVIDALQRVGQQEENFDAPRLGERSSASSEVDLDLKVPGGQQLGDSQTAVGMSHFDESSGSEIPAELLQTVDLDGFLDGFTPGATTVRLDGHGRSVLLADGANRVHLISRGNREYVDSFDGASMRLTGVATHLNGGAIFGAEMNGRILRWRIDRGRSDAEAVAEVGERILAMDADRSGTSLVIGTERGRLVGCDPRTGETREHARFSQPIGQICVDPSGTVGLVALLDGEILEVGLASGEGTEIARVDEGAVALEIDERRTWASVIERNGVVQVFNLDDQSHSFRLEPIPASLRSISFSPDGRMLGLSLSDSLLRLWVFHREAVARPPEVQ